MSVIKLSSISITYMGFIILIGVVLELILSIKEIKS